MVDAAPDANWRDALDECFAANLDRGRGPANTRALAKELRDRHPEGQSSESWRRQISRYRSGEQQPTEEVAVKIADALQVRRSALPTSGLAPTIRQLDVRLRALEARELVDARDIHRLLDVVTLLANRDTRAALRALEEMRDANEG